MEKILKQSFWLFSAQVITRIIGFFYVVYLAKLLGVSDFGLYSVSLAYFSIISSVADFGFNRFLTREVAIDYSKASELLWNVTFLRLSLSCVLFAVFSVILYFFDPDKLRVSMVLLATLAILPQAIAFTFDAIFVAMQKLQFSAIALLFSGLATAGAGFWLVGNGFGPIGAINALIIGQFAYVVILVSFLYKKRMLVLSRINMEIIKKAIIGSIPYGLLGVLGLLYFRIDTVLLSYLKGSFETGIYGAAYKFLESITFIPSAFSVALFPVLARSHETSVSELKKLYFKSLKILLALSLIILLAYLFILPEVIKRFLPNYLPSIEAVRILALAIPFMFIHVPGVAVLFSTDKYLKQVLMLSMATVAFNVLANLIFIPQFGFIAASWITVISEVLSFIIFFLLIKIKIFNK